ncbi:TlpA family protein disulfide reductase [Leptothrix discophora]|uniref:TlpA disulfide reductase family protein n=1 Tax=Leptothrix discophora TaxID=89 RepID=A0ABT9G5D7_LEPDI|nr:TlpA disulfide reductase family protein [Leptothrix discophora]MDP4301703.1 TlpA disulfide reductase family protein [Leptothrix discophora]
MNRRNLTLGAVAGVALVAGIGWSLRRSGSTASTPSTAASAAAPATADAASANGGDVWSLGFDRPEGGRIELASLKGKPLAINFWATWCPPCVREMPLLDAWARKHADHGLTVLGLAVDSPSPVREYLLKTPVSFPIGLTGFSGTELARQLGNEQGGLPFTVVFNAAGEPIIRKLGETQEADLAAWSKALGL